MVLLVRKQSTFESPILRYNNQFLATAENDCFPAPPNGTSQTQYIFLGRERTGASSATLTIVVTEDYGRFGSELTFDELAAIASTKPEALACFMTSARIEMRRSLVGVPSA